MLTSMVVVGTDARSAFMGMITTSNASDEPSPLALKRQFVSAVLPDSVTFTSFQKHLSDFLEWKERERVMKENTNDEGLTRITKHYKPPEIENYFMTKQVIDGKTVSREYVYYAEAKMPKPTWPAKLNDIFEAAYDNILDPHAPAFILEFGGKDATPFKKDAGRAGTRDKAYWIAGDVEDE